MDARTDDAKTISPRLRRGVINSIWGHMETSLFKVKVGVGPYAGLHSAFLIACFFIVYVDVVLCLLSCQPRLAATSCFVQRYQGLISDRSIV